MAMKRKSVEIIDEENDKKLEPKILKPNIETSKMRLNFEFFNNDCLDLSKALLGKLLIRRINNNMTLKARIVEVEAYLGGDDKASHSFGNKRTDRNEAMYMKAGTAYVYNIYGCYCCFNISAKEPGAGVLVRALEPLEGIDFMKQNRKISKSSFKLMEIASGPSRLCQAFDITKNKINKMDLSESEELWLENDPNIDENTFEIGLAKRINIDYAGEDAINKLYRFYIRNNLHVSGPKSALT